MTNTAGFMISPAAPYKNLNTPLLHQSNELDKYINKYTFELYMFIAIGEKKTNKKNISQ